MLSVSCVEKNHSLELSLVTCKISAGSSALNCFRLEVGHCLMKRDGIARLGKKGWGDICRESEIGPIIEYTLYCLLFPLSNFLPDLSNFVDYQVLRYPKVYTRVSSSVRLCPIIF